MKACIYSRVSSQEQAREGQSISTQIKLCQSYAKENKINIVSIYKDEGKSGLTTKRAGLQSLLEEVMSKKSIDHVLVQDTDRLARNTLDHLSLKALFKKHNTTLISISQPMIDDSPEGRFIDTVLAGANALQSQITGRKTSKVMEQKAKAGWHPGYASPGYQNTINPKPTSNLDKKIITPHPTNGPLITQMFKLYSTSAHTLDSLTKKMKQLGLTTNTKKLIGKSSVARCLNSPFYYGALPWKDKIYPGKHKPLTTKTIWDNCQQVLATHNQHASRTRKHFYLLRGYVYCNQCQHRLWAAPHKGSTTIVHYYYCHQCRKGTYTGIKDLEKQVARWVSKLQVTDKYAQELAKVAKTTLKQIRNTTQDEERLLINQKTAIKKKLETTEDRLIDGTLNKKQFKRISDRLETELNQLEDTLNTTFTDYTEKFERIKNLVQMARNLKLTYKQADDDLKRHFLDLFFNKFMVQEGKITEAIPSEDIKPLLKNGKIKVRAKTNWLRGRDSNSQPSA
ncbi:recombinase family protein [Patescibacteria group bacterium]